MALADTSSVSTAFVAMAADPRGTGDRHEKTNDDDGRKILSVKFAPIAGTKDEKFQKDFPCYFDGLVSSLPGRYVTMPEYPKRAEAVYNLKPRPDDVYILTFPKCGSSNVRLHVSQIKTLFLSFF